VNRGAEILHAALGLVAVGQSLQHLVLADA